MTFRQFRYKLQKHQSMRKGHSAEAVTLFGSLANTQLSAKEAAPVVALSGSSRRSRSFEVFIFNSFKSEPPFPARVTLIAKQVSKAQRTHGTERASPICQEGKLPYRVRYGPIPNKGEKAMISLWHKKRKVLGNQRGFTLIELHDRGGHHRHPGRHRHPSLRKRPDSCPHRARRRPIRASLPRPSAIYTAHMGSLPGSSDRPHRSGHERLEPGRGSVHGLYPRTSSGWLAGLGRHLHVHAERGRRNVHGHRDG